MGRKKKLLHKKKKLSSMRQKNKIWGLSKIT